MSYDIESLLNDVQVILAADLNTKITAINSEKGDLPLRSINASAYFMDMDEKSANWDPIVLYAVTNIDSEGIGPTTSKEVTVNIALILSDDGLDEFVIKRMLRYGRALEEVIEEKWFNKRGVGILKIESLPVLSFQRSDNSQRYKIVGINLVTSFA